MRVAREFNKLAVVHGLETVREEELEAFLKTAPKDPKALELREWQLQEIDAGIREADTEPGIPHEKVKAWVESWGMENELPMPE
ncbi:MAG: hypothetical protein HQL52_08710 [Magnetococcales bacterium]|nr:hypothetical protein [Magnetococcales bacterium]